MTFCEEVVLNVLALDRAFKDYAFLHVYLGPAAWLKRASRIPPARAYERLRDLAARLDEAGIPDEPPRFRKTYLADLLRCVLTQAEVFAFKRRRPFARTVESLMAAELPRPFRLEPELSEIKRLLRQQGFASASDYRRSKKRIRLRTRQELLDFVLAALADVSGRLARRCGDAFGFDLAELVTGSRLKVVTPGRGDPPCFYRYDGRGRGTLGIALKTEFSVSYLKGFISHEAVPGHHLYYLVKQRRIDQGTTDPIDFIDTFYSPENVINEGLAVCADRLYGQVLDDSSHLSAQLEKFMHRVIYNAWHRVNIQGLDTGRAADRILRGELGLSEEVVARELRYHTRQARHYTPVYPLGIRYVEELAAGLPLAQVPRLYEQHSVATLRKLHRTLCPSPQAA